RRLLRAAERERDAALAERDAARDTAAARTRFLAQMSHELRTPLNAIIGFSDIMRSRLFGPLPERYGEYAGLIHESGEHLLSMINDVLDLAKTEAGRYELRRSVFDARDALNAALRLVRVQADEAGIDLRASPAPAPIMVDADERALKQMALNLLANALKFTPRGGHVTAAVAPVDGELQLQVADTGQGIPPADLERLGRPFEQAESARGRGGTGLGLSLVRSFAELHGGAMRIESRLGAGTAVTVRMPVLAANETETF
ncbi:MAG: HAMP domain-containing histidine kinase, partial [Caulobacteraceae bacterium]|nr:HAMP domain-containing histidine kinase [Caulobacter sp.]